MMQLTFYQCVVPDHDRNDHLRRGGRSLQRFSADVADGQLRVSMGREPCGKGGKRLWHACVSVCVRGTAKPRKPSDAEMQALIQHLSGVEWEEDNSGSAPDSWCRHLWEKETG